ncbi:MAG: GNAT family N-acetyltransferase [Candidatus Marinimicrobia bacterium]|jgi:ribosomal protein S18 acetylase RimI-like enzyme|nr:GNAT family N-acetyltransferase [Candidatus Neomarinimicrobiota bacterium]HIF29862.1 N-acetyltransferase [Candidatus Neomarinimicrobiota bacterium]
MHKEDCISIESFKKEYISDFYTLNKKWIEESFLLEESDKFDLLNPEESIINKGGEIFFALIEDKPIATVAMIPIKSDTYELAKMTVDTQYRGNGIANKLMDKCILFAKEKKVKEIILITNDTLVIARNLYDKYGFKEVPLDSDKYLRGNVKMTLNLVKDK